MMLTAFQIRRTFLFFAMSQPYVEEKLSIVIFCGNLYDDMVNPFGYGRKMRQVFVNSWSSKGAMLAKPYASW